MDVVLICARAVLALVFIAAGVGKLLDLAGSRTALLGFGLPDRWATPGAWILPVVELVAAAALLTQPFARAGAALAVLLLLAFIVGVVYALRQGYTPDCHCFGQLHSAPAGRGTIIRNGVLAAPAVLILVAGPGDALAGADADEAALVAAGALVAALAAATAVLLRENGRLRRGAAAGAPAPLEIGTRAPELQLRDTNGSQLEIADVIDDERPSILVFVQPGCGACSVLLPNLDRWRPALAEHLSLVVISGPDYQSGRAQVGSGPPHMLWDVEKAANRAYKLMGSPSAVQIDPDGTIASAPALGNTEIEALIRVARRQGRRPRRAAA